MVSNPPGLRLEVLLENKGLSEMICALSGNSKKRGRSCSFVAGEKA